MDRIQTPNEPRRRMLMLPSLSLSASLLAGPAGAQAPPPDDPPVPPTEADEIVAPPEPERQYRSHDELSEALRTLARGHSGVVKVTTIGSSRESRDLLALRLAADGDVDPESRPALLITAGIDGDHLVGSDVAVDVARRLTALLAEGDERATALLSANTVYIVPRLNPDAAERFFADVKLDWRRNVRPTDEDRDAETDEDHPNDINGDGLITMMRVYDPEKADMMPDPEDGRLHVKPDRNKGERAEFAIMIEGVDDDGDEAINDDWIGGVDLNRNFPHGYEEHSGGAGPYQLSEPESLALVDFVLDRPNIAVALTYGVHDNLSKTPDGKGQHPSSAPKNIDERDVGLYTFIGERFKEITGLKDVPSETAQGAFFDWAYAQFGTPSFTTPLWTRPEAKEDDKQKNEGDAAPKGEGDDAPLTPSGIGDISQETLDELEALAVERGFEVTPEMRAQLTAADVEQFAGMMGIKVRRVNQNAGGGGAGGRGGRKGAGGANKEEAAWLAYADEVRGDGFIAWTEVAHPQFDKVEVGGWMPYFKLNPPAGEVNAIAEKQVEFVLDLLGRLPEVSIAEPEVTRLSPGLFEVELAVVNDGYFPTGTAMATRNRKGRPYVLRLDVPVERIISGQRVQKYWSIAGSGGRETARWIIQSEDSAAVDVVLFSEKFGEVRRTIQLGQVGVDDVEEMRNEVRP